MTITIYIAYNERRNQLTKATAEVVDELPNIGETTHGGQFVIDQIQKFDPDIATFSNDAACDYDYYWIHEAGANGYPYSDEDNERYVAIRKPEEPEELFSDLREITHQESGIILYESGDAIICNWSACDGLPRVFAGGLIGLNEKIAVTDQSEGKDISRFSPEEWDIVYDENGDYPDAVNAIDRFRWYKVKANGEEATVIAPLSWN